MLANASFSELAKTPSLISLYVSVILRQEHSFSLTSAKKCVFELESHASLWKQGVFDMIDVPTKIPAARIDLS